MHTSTYLYLTALFLLGCRGDKGDEGEIGYLALVDADGDGSHEGTDCDDTDPLVNPDAAEVCNGIDDNCDDFVDDADPAIDPGSYTDYYPDADGDGFGDGIISENPTFEKTSF